MLKSLASTSLFLFLLVTFNLISTSYAFDKYCKCDCDLNYKVFNLKEVLDKEKDQPNCKSCNQEFCLSQNIETCSDQNEDELKDTMTAVCFQRESLKDMFVVYSFVLLICGLCGYVVFCRLQSGI